MLIAQYTLAAIFLVAAGYIIRAMIRYEERRQADMTEEERADEWAARQW